MVLSFPAPVENGAGKSTIMKVLAGVNTNYTGTIIWKGEEIVAKSIAEQRERGVEIIYQHQCRQCGKHTDIGHCRITGIDFHSLRGGAAIAEKFSQAAPPLCTI